MREENTICPPVQSSRSRNLCDINREKSFCPKGHPYSGENLIITKKGYRGCRACHKLRNREYKRNLRVQLGPPKTSLEKTCCPSGHPYSGANLSFSSSGYRVCKQCMRDSARRRYYANRSKHNQRVEGSNGISKHTAFLVDEAINAGWTIAEITGRSPFPKGARIVAESPLRRFRRNNPRISKLWEKQLTKSNAGKIRRVVAAPDLLRNGGLDANEAVMQATRNTWGPIRSFVMTDMLIAIGDGTLLLREAVARVKEFERIYNRQNKHSVESRHGNLSLDQPLFEDGTSTWTDAYSDGQSIWGEESIYAK